MKASPRLYVEEPLHADQQINLDRNAAHYVVNVMRRNKGDDLRLFNGRDGEWQARIMQANRKTVQLRITQQTRAFATVPDVWLLFAPVKKSRSECIVEKATELGVRALQPVRTRRTTARPLRDERMQLICREAAEQTERLDVPQIFPCASLDDVLHEWDKDRTLIFCDEAGENGRACTMHESLARSGSKKTAILIGPEGGFAPEERIKLCALPFVCPVSLGPRILRADTAAIAALALWQSVCGDWVPS